MNEYLETALYVLGMCIIIVVGWYYWKGYYPGSSYIVEQPPIPKNGLDPGQAKFMFFYTTWCPWSHKAWPKWKSFKQLMENNQVKYGDQQILFEEIDCEADKGKAALYKIAGYPTFKLGTTEQTYVFRGIPDPKTFDVFLQACLGKKSSS
jgi:thiol-disulfide isomerase/thioredoxin